MSLRGRTSSFLITLSLLCPLVWTGCGGGGGAAVQIVTILSSNPSNGSSGVSLGAFIQVTFERAMKRSSVEAAFSVAPAVAGAFQWNAGSTVMTFVPSALLPVTTAHTVRIQTTAEAADGGRLGAEFVLNFTTGSTVAQLSGALTDPANTRLPDLPILPPAASNLGADDRPNGTGLKTSRTRLLVAFNSAATVGDANALLISLNAVIAGSIPAINLLLIEIPDTGNWSGLDNALSALQASPAVGLVVQDVVIEGAVVTVPSPAADPNVGDRSGNVPGGLNPNPWVWNFPPSVNASTDGNWGLEAGRVPQMWNLNDFAARQPVNIRTGVLDAGFNDTNGDGTNDHPQLDLLSLETWVRQPAGFGLGASVHWHGQHVAGIIGALFDNGIGTDGVNPFAERHTPADGHFLGVSVTPVGGGIQAMIASIINDLWQMLNNWPDLRAVNLSLGYNWGLNTYDNASGRSTTDPNTNAAAQQMAASQGLLVRTVAASHPQTLLLAAAGNDSASIFGYANEIDAQWASPFAWAARGPARVSFLPPFSGGVAAASPNILVIESVDAVVADTTGPPGQWVYTKSNFSNVGGILAAPGGRILSSVGNNLVDSNGNPYANNETLDGTSMATAFVTGLVGYLLNLDSTLTVAQLVTALTSATNTHATVVRAGESPLPGGVSGPAPLVDAFSVALGIDVIKTLQKALVDVDDGTLDGNQRTLRGNTGVEIGTFVAVTTPDSRRGDGKISMADFRALRDALIESALIDWDGDGTPDLPSARVDLDGSDSHFKKDLNFDGCVGTLVAAPAHPTGIPVPASCANAPSEAQFQRYDFNGDGRVNLNPVGGTSGFPPFNTHDWADLEVLKDVWPADPDLNEGWQAEELIDLLPSPNDSISSRGSGDIEFRAGVTLGPSAAMDEIRITKILKGRPFIRSLTATNQALAWTLPIEEDTDFTVEGYKNNSKVKDLCKSGISGPLGKHGRDTVITVGDCTNAMATESSAHASYKFPGIPSITTMGLEGVDATEYFNCPTLAVGETCTFTRTQDAVNSTGRVEFTFSHPTADEWQVVAKTVSEARIPTLPTMSPWDTCAGLMTYELCGTDSYRHVLLRVAVPIEVAGKIAMTVSCEATGDVQARVDTPNNATATLVLDGDTWAPALSFTNCKIPSSLVPPGWSLNTSDTFGLSGRIPIGSPVIGFQLDANASAAQDVSVYPPGAYSYAQTITSNLIKLTISVS